MKRLPSPARRTVLGLLALGAAGAFWRARRPTGELTMNPLRRLLGDQAAAAGFARIEGPTALVFPRDHGPHRAFRHEWWYFTGNLADDAGNPFGFQLTFFRFALTGAAPQLDSAWATNEAMLGHFAVSDIEAQRFVAVQKLERPVLGLAGATADHIWVGQWHARLSDPARECWQLQARDGRHSLMLELEPRKPRVLQGDAGYSRKGDAKGNASCYYSATRLAARGKLDTGHGELAVQGSAWLDREWGSGSLDRETMGWDWFGLQLSDGSELMLYRLRRTNGRVSRWSAGSLVAPDGIATQLKAGDFVLSPQRHWESPSSGIRYPLRWSLRIAALDLVLDVEARLDAQEWDGIVRYWEGSVATSGHHAGRPVRGAGYMELTGYA